MLAVHAEAIGSLLRPAELESLEILRRRIVEAQRYVPLERLGLSPQCGFASLIIGNRITAEGQRQKLELLVNAVQALW